jgi:hypothetical protein
MAAHDAVESMPIFRGIRTVLIKAQILEGADQFAIPSGRHGQDEFQLAPALIGHFCQMMNVVEAQQAAICHQDDTVNREALQNGLQHGLQRLGLCDIAGVNSMHEWQAIRRLHNAQDKLAGDAAALLVHSERPDVILDRAFPMDAHCGQVIEDNSQIAIDQGADLTRQGVLDSFAIVQKRIHGAQQVLVRHAVRHRGNGNSFQPAQAAQFAVWFAQAVEHHGADQGFGVKFPATGTQRAVERLLEPQFTT